MTVPVDVRESTWRMVGGTPSNAISLRLSSPLGSSDTGGKRSALFPAKSLSVPPYKSIDGVLVAKSGILSPA